MGYTSIYRYLIAKIMLVTAFCFFFSANAQRDRIWYFGNRAGVDFGSGQPLPLTDNQINTYEGTAIVCDENGQLLFYTEGERVFNRNHVVMPDGRDLNGGRSSTQSALGVQNPMNPNRYYLFTADEFVGVGMHYSEIDMTADNGLGDVTVKNVMLLDRGCEKLSAISHANGTDTWVVGHQWNSDAFYAWRVSASGISAPVISRAGSVIVSPNPFIVAAGQMKFSPDGTKLALANTDMNAQLFDFDSATGIVSNPLTLKTGYEFGLEFSPSGNALYLSETASTSFNIFQFNLDAPDIVASMIPITNTGRAIVWGMMNLGPDSRIYIASVPNNGTGFPMNRLSYIEKPDVIGLGCNLVPQAVPLAGRNIFYGLPTAFQPGLYITDIEGEGDCAGNTITFSADVTQAPDSAYWDFGDSTSSTDLNPTHSYAVSGVYSVRLKIRKNGYERYFTKTVTILPNPIANTPPNLQLCEDDGAEVFDLSSQNALILGTQLPANFTVSYHLNAIDAESGTNALPLSFTNISNPQTLFARVTSVSGCYAVTSFNVAVIPKPIIEMPLDYVICNGNAITLNAPPGFDGYLWSTLETSSSITVSQAGNFSVTVTQITGTANCSSIATINVIESTSPIIRNINIRDWTDNNNSIEIIVDGRGDYEYSLDGIEYQDSPIFTGLLPGIYSIYVRDKSGCGAATGEVLLLMYPKFFTPNGDGFNDFWNVRNAHLEPVMKISIFDRYGKLLTFFNGNDQGWDGNYSGKQLPSTDYWFVITRSNGKEYKGHFSMLR